MGLSRIRSSDLNKPRRSDLMKPTGARRRLAGTELADPSKKTKQKRYKLGLELKALSLILRGYETKKKKIKVFFFPHFCIGGYNLQGTNKTDRKSVV